MLAVAAAGIGEDDEAKRGEEFLLDSSPAAPARLAAGFPAQEPGRFPAPRFCVGLAASPGGPRTQDSSLTAR